jgi:hypothetical protein
MVQKLLSDPDIDAFLRGELDCTVITVDADGDTTSNEADGDGPGAPLPDDRGD